MDQFLYPPLERRGRFIQLTSYDKGPMPELPGILAEWSRKCVTLKPGVELEAGSASGPGLITRIFAGFPAWWRPSLYREIALRLYWDGETVPAVEAPLGDFFGIHHCTYRQYNSRLFSIVSGGIASAAPMPFSKGFRLTFTQEGSVPVPLFFFGLGYYELDPADTSSLRFRCQWRRDPLCRAGQPFTLLETAGEGFYAGVHLSTQNRDRWLRPPLHEWALPRGFGLGHLEGWEELFVDGSEKSLHTGTGHEEYFNTGWYFADGAFTGTDWGCLHRSYLTGRTASYRYHWLDPIPFKKSFRAVIHHGVFDSIPADYSSCAYWYQKGPANSTYRMPPARDRLPFPRFGARVGGYR